MKYRLLSCLLLGALLLGRTSYAVTPPSAPSQAPVAFEQLSAPAPVARAVNKGDPAIAKAFARPVANRLYQGEEIQVVLAALGTAADVTIIPDPDVKGKVDTALNNMTLQGALRAVCVPLGFYYTEEPGGWISVRQKRMVIFAVNYPQMTRNGQSSASVTVSGGSGSGGGGGSGGSMIQNANSSSSTGSNSGMSGGSGGSGGGSSDTTSFSIQQQNQADFWKTLETRVKSMAGKDESVMVDAFSGLVTVDGGARTIDKIHSLLNAVNRRIGTRIDIKCRIVEVTTNNQEKMGVDWHSVAGIISQNPVIGFGLPVAGMGSQGQNVRGITGATNYTNGLQFNPDTLTGTLSMGKVDAVITALKTQGDVKQVSNPQLSTLNNQTAFIKDGIDKPYFSLTSKVTINSGGSTVAGTQPITENQYTKQTYSIGTAMSVTPSCEGDVVTMDVAPSLTRFEEDVFSPDKTQSAPTLGNKQTGLIVRVKSGETAMVGGLITQTDSKTFSGIPILGSLPYLGKLFSTNGTIKNTTELVIFLTPTIVRYEDQDCVVADPMRNIDAPFQPAGRLVEGLGF